MTKPDSATEILAAVAAAYAARPDVSADDIVSLVTKLRQEFGSSVAVAAAEPPQGSGSALSQPAIAIEKAVTHDKVYCLCCGKGFKMLKRHLGAEHGLSEAAYRARFGLSEDFPLVAPSYSDRKASYARKVGFGKYDRYEARPDRTPVEEALKAT